MIKSIGQLMKQALKKLPQQISSLSERRQTVVRRCVVGKMAETSTSSGEECDFIIHVNKNGSCKFKIIGKADQGSPSTSLQMSTTNTDKQVASCETSEKQTDSEGDNTNGQGGSDNAFPPTTMYVGLDCEFVGVGRDQSALGRCSIVDYEGKVLCDIYAKPNEKITTYRTRWSGITRAHMDKAIPQEFALAKIHKILKDKIVVGHDLKNDFDVLHICPEYRNVRDTSHYQFYDKMLADGTVAQKRSLKALAKNFLGIEIQRDAHCSVIDAQTTMKLYRLVREDWESQILHRQKNPKDPGPDSNGSSSDANNSSPPTSDNTGLSVCCNTMIVKRKGRKRPFQSQDESISVAEKQYEPSSDICDKKNGNECTKAGDKLVEDNTMFSYRPSVSKKIKVNNSSKKIQQFSYNGKSVTDQHSRSRNIAVPETDKQLVSGVVDQNVSQKNTDGFNILIQDGNTPVHSLPHEIETFGSTVKLLYEDKFWPNFDHHDY